MWSLGLNLFSLSTWKGDTPMVEWGDLSQPTGGEGEVRECRVRSGDVCWRCGLGEMRVGRRQGDLLGDEEGERDMLGDMEMKLAREGAGDDVDGVDLEELSLSRLGVLSKGMRDLDEEECLGLNKEL